MVGAAAECRHLQRQLQANTIRSRRVLSLLSLGQRIIRTGVHIAARELLGRTCRDPASSAIQAANPLHGLPICGDPSGLDEVRLRPSTPRRMGASRVHFV